jgi:hypothetical protein
MNDEEIIKCIIAIIVLAALAAPAFVIAFFL